MEEQARRYKGPTTHSLFWCYEDRPGPDILLPCWLHSRALHQPISHSQKTFTKRPAEISIFASLIASPKLLWSTTTHGTLGPGTIPAVYPAMRCTNKTTKLKDSLMPSGPGISTGTRLLCSHATVVLKRDTPTCPILHAQHCPTTPQTLHIGITATRFPYMRDTGRRS